MRADRWTALAPTLLVSAGLLLLGALAPLGLSDFRLSLLAKFLTWAIVALSLDLLWGYAGLLSLGHGVFFGLGAYALAMHLKLEAAGSDLPDFMAWSGLRALPWWWEPFRQPWVAFPAAVLLPMGLAGLLGYLAFRSRVREVYFALITQALALIATILLVGQQPYTGGTNGITNFRTVLGLPLAAPSVRLGLYVLTLLALVGCYLFCRALTGSRLGWLLVALRDNEGRLRCLGYDVVWLKTLVFALSAGMAGLAGALFVLHVGIISPALVGVVPSLEMVIWVAVGGRGTLIGPIVGAVLVNAAKSGLSESFPEVWQFFLGALFVGSVLLFPEGLAGALRQVAARGWARAPVPRPLRAHRPAREALPSLEGEA